MRVFYGDEEPVLETVSKDSTNSKLKSKPQTEVESTSKTLHYIRQIFQEHGLSVDWVWISGYSAFMIKSPGGRSVLYVLDRVKGTFDGVPAQFKSHRDLGAPQLLSENDILISDTQNDVFYVSGGEWESLV